MGRSNDVLDSPVGKLLETDKGLFFGGYAIIDAGE
jgi:hypothetical protein